MRTWLVLSALLFAGGCGNRATLEWAAPGFGPGPLARDGLFVVAAVEAASVPGATALGEDEQQLSRALAAALRDAAPGQDIVGWTDTARALGEEACRELVGAYRDRGRLDEDRLRALGEATLPLGRYAVFARIERDELGSAGSLTHELRPLRGETAVQAVDGRRRELRVAFDIFDLQAAALAYTVTLEGDEEATRRYTRSAETLDDEPILEPGGEGIERSHAPPAPARLDLFAELSADFARRVLR